MKDILYGCASNYHKIDPATWMLRDRLPMVSCLMPTHGRCPHHQHLLEEAVESFLRQDYFGARELIILNDCKEHHLICHAPGVIVINDWYRAPTLGEKYNRMLDVARGELVCTWEDDDISLPWRISLSVNKLGEFEYFNPKAYWVICGDVFKFEKNTGYAHNASMYRRDTARRLGGYPADCKQDAGMDSKLRRNATTIDGFLDAHEAFYIYRWGVTDHLSGNGDPEQAYLQRASKKQIKGAYTLNPHWAKDYVEMASLTR